MRTGGSLLRGAVLHAILDAAKQRSGTQIGLCATPFLCAIHSVSPTIRDLVEDLSRVVEELGSIVVKTPATKRVEAI